MSNLATAGLETSNSDAWTPRRLWSLWDIMNRLNAGRIGQAFATMLELSERAAAEPSDDVISDYFRRRAIGTAHSAKTAIFSLGLVESTDALDRFEENLSKPHFPNKALNLDLLSLAKLMQSELEKLHAFALERDKQKYFRDESWGVEISPLGRGIAPPPPALFSRRAQDAFPSAGMDIVEAGRCMALSRNNAAIYHLMQVAEIGLRALAWDRRVTIQRGKSRTIVPLDFAQWGEIIGELEKKKGLINTWKRGKAIREEAIQYYSSVIFEVSSFNEIYRKHISHARGMLYEDDTAVSCWGHVYRFMDKLAERMSETERTRLVWKTKK